MDDDKAFAEWIAELRRLAAEREIDWLLCGNGEARRPSFQNGVSPTDELDSLERMAEWRGCGCGGGG